MLVLVVRPAILLALLAGTASAFAPSAVSQSAVSSSSALFAGVDRRDALAKAGQSFAVAGASLTAFGIPSPAQAEGTKKVVVAGATGQTGVSGPNDRSIALNSIVIFMYDMLIHLIALCPLHTAPRLGATCRLGKSRGCWWSPQCR